MPDWLATRKLIYYRINPRLDDIQGTDQIFRFDRDGRHREVRCAVLAVGQEGVLTPG
jgi:hypothetical protein